MHMNHTNLFNELIATRSPLFHSPCVFCNCFHVANYVIMNVARKTKRIVVLPMTCTCKARIPRLVLNDITCYVTVLWIDEVRNEFAKRSLKKRSSEQILRV